MKKGFLLLLSLLLFFSKSEDIHAQDSTCTKPLVYLGARVHKTFLIQQPRELIQHLDRSFPFSLEADISWHLRKKEIWDYCNCYPRTGFAFQYMNFGYPEVMGSAFAIIPFIEPYFRASRKLNFSMRFGVGPTLLTKLHDELSNPENIFFSSHLSFTSHFNVAVNYRLTDQLSVRLAANLHHISNANLAQPNLGVNLPTINVGVDYSLQKVRFENRVKDPDMVLNPQKNRVDLFAGLAFQPSSFQGTELYPVYSLITNYSRVVGRIFGVTGGLEFNSYRSMRERIREFDMTDETSGKYIDHKRMAVTTGIELLMGRFILSPQLGYYLYCPYDLGYKMSQRYNLNVKITDHILVGASVKVHRRDVDFMEFRMGMYF